MATEQDQLALLFGRLADGSATAQEIEAYFQLVKNPALESQVTELMSAELSRTDSFQEMDRERLDRVYASVREANLKIAEHQPRRLRLWPRMAIAAAMAVVVFGTGLFFYKLDRGKGQPTEMAYRNDVSPGGAGATLTLASGMKIRLSDAGEGKLAQEAGVSISKSADDQLVYRLSGTGAGSGGMNSLTTAKGETYRLRLPDGSLVYLNAASSLSYSASLLEKGKRVVDLSGEGYFEVAKDKLHPFIVRTAGQEVEVLGTHFNVNSYADEPAVATTLLEGSVRVRTGGIERVIVPGQQAVSSSAGISVAKADVEGVTDWKDGDFYLDGVEFRAAMRKIARWYDMEVVYDASVPGGIRSGGWVSRNNPLSTVLKSIEASGQVHFKVRGRQILVSR